MPLEFHWLEATLRYLLTAEGGRSTGVRSGYRGQFHYEDDDQAWDAVQYFPDIGEEDVVAPGTAVRGLLRFRETNWEQVHSKRLQVGTQFEIREGRRIVGRGTVTELNANAQGLDP